MNFLADQAFNAQFTRTVGHIVSGGAELSECLSIAKKINCGCRESWYEQWRGLADRLKNNAQGSSSISSGEMLLRASNYYRTAYFFLEQNPEDHRIRDSLQESKKTFAEALKKLKIPCAALDIPFEGGTLPAYLYRSASVDAPLLIDMGGGDSTLEELYFTSGAPALKRGMHCLTFEGPGQGSVLRFNKIPFRYDSEKVVTAVMDFLAANFPEIGKKAALRGDSFGGYLAARAAAFEKRISACILNPGILNAASGMGKLNSDFKRKVLFLLKPDLQFKIESRYMRFGAHSYDQMVKAVQKFNLTGIAKQISCPTLVIDNQDEHITKGQALQLFNELTCPKTYYLFKTEQHSGGHCQPLAQLQTQELIFDWLNKTL